MIAYAYVRRSSQARIVIDTSNVTVFGESGGPQGMPRDSVGSIELARGSMAELQLTEGLAGEGHVAICSRSADRRIEVSIDRYGMTDAEALAKYLEVPLIMTRQGDSRRWSWSGRNWNPLADDQPAALITESPEYAPPLTLRGIRPRTAIIVFVILGVLAIPLFGPLVLSLIQAGRH